ncbi:hypothetical protein [Cohnella abietis]|uniref:Flagellar protein FlbD n=1 Tax=Cohnella abietis TaxID=2507935 RepID=A0A3T1D2U6_9BACL|nr:hypothetical protein [Cohnella abietis]BBI32349.1 hypothetical protein KCTCHS21_17480 [Cohnella abietis]
MIKLTGEYNKPVYIAPEQITAVNQHESIKTFVSTVDGGFVVTDSPEVIARTILDYKLTILKYQAAVNVGDFKQASIVHESLKIFAGLEG